MADRCVVRNAQYRRGGLNKRERHNERKNLGYQNDDIISERAAFNVHFKRCEDGYERTFDAMLAEGAISTRGLKSDPHIVDELVFDVNSAYFENHGGYDYAKSFFEEAYRCAVEEIGGEEYVLSAVMHADERNKALSDKLGRDVFHYHLHVVYIPVVDKEIKWSKRCKDPALVGTTKAIIKQVSHSKKWPKLKQLDENGEVKRNSKGNAILINSYSLLQDHFFEHMRDAGFQDFERGERGSTAEHLSVLEYKTQKESERAAAMTDLAKGLSEAASDISQQVERKSRQLEGLERRMAISKDEAATFAEIDALPKKTLGGNLQFSPADWKKIANLAKEGIKSRSIISGLKKRVSDLLRKITGLEKDLEQFRGKGVTDLMRYYEARQRAPRRLAETLADIKRQPPEPSGQDTPDRQRSAELGR